MPVSICTRLKKIQREFLWSGGSLEKKPHLVNWKIDCTEKKKGVLACIIFHSQQSVVVQMVLAFRQ